MEQAQDLARVLHAAARQIEEAMPRLRGFRDITHYTVELNRLENDGDHVEQRRVEYDWQASAQAVRERVGELPARRIELARFDVD